MIYFDNSVTIIPYPRVPRTYQEVASKTFGNPSSLHSLGIKASRILEASRKRAADLLGAKSTEIIFASGGIENNNWVFKGVAFERERCGRHVVVSDIEHPAVKEPAKRLSEHGSSVSYAPVNDQGSADIKALVALLRPDTILVSVMIVNNEVGSIQPIKEASESLADKPGILFHMNAVQATGKIPAADYLADCVNFVGFSRYKFRNIRGVGSIYRKEGKRLNPLLAGGGQKGDLCSTTGNVVGIATMARALHLVADKEAYALPKIAKMKEVIYDELAKYKDIVISSGKDDTLAPNILTSGIEGICGKVMVHVFKEHKIYTSTAPACSSETGKPAEALIVMGVLTKLAQLAVRISLDDDSDVGQVGQFLTIFKQACERTRKVR